MRRIRDTAGADDWSERYKRVPKILLERYLALCCVINHNDSDYIIRLGADWLLKIIQTPEDIFADASIYIKVIFAGIPASVLYNYSASALRAAGDSRHPFYRVREK